MHLLTQSCVLFLWMYTLNIVESQDCTLAQFLRGPLFDTNFDTTDLENSYPGGKQVRVGCNVGYSGFFKLICSQGKWLSRGTKCEPKPCGHPGDAQFADFRLEKGEDFVFGSQVVYTCHQGYQMVSRINFRRCMAEGWDGVVPVCEAQQCPLIRVDSNVQVIGDPEEANYGNVVRFSCKSNAEILNGSSEIYCDEKGVWSGKAPTCIEIKCPVPVIENGFVPDKRLYNEHEVLNFVCQHKYKRTEDRPSKCTKIGIRAEWSPTPACEPIKCRLTLPALTGTRYDPAYRSLFSPDDTVSVICGEKYGISTRQETSAVATCQEDGKWNIRPICQEVTCLNQRDPHMSWWSFRWGQKITLGDTTRYTCRSGYRSTGGATTVTCTRDGWSPNPLCQEITCDRKEYQTADITSNFKQKYRFNERVYYDCKDGYQGSFSLTCGENGWSGSEDCTEITCRIQYFQNAEIDRSITVSQSEYKYNDRVEYICNNGYEGRFSLTCGARGWLGTPECSSTGRGCEKPDISNAYIFRNEKESYTHSERVQYVCRNDIEKKFTVTCEQGVWTGIQSCADTTACPKPDVPHGFVVKLNDTVYYTCDKGYKLSSKGWWGEAKCNDGAWPDLQTCIGEKSCGEMPVIPNMKNVDVNAQDQTIPIICEEGYNAQVDRLTCVKGKWHSARIPFKEICKPIADPCKPPLKVENAVVVTSYQKEYLSGSEVTYKCRNKYIKEGEDTIRCKDGKWGKQNFNCALYCYKPKDDQQTMTFTDSKEKYVNGEVIGYECDIQGEKTRRDATCFDGEWSKPVGCQVKPCELPDDTPNGHYQLIHGDDFVFGATIKYFCDEGYQMVSKDDTRTCYLDKWSNHVPICQPMSCETPAADGMITVKGLPENGDPILPDRFLKFSCDGPGTYLNGSSVLICGKDGRWDNPFPSCEEITCDVEVMQPHLNVVGLQSANKSVKIGHKLQFICDNDFSLDGSEVIECLETGRWSSPFPTCSDKCTVTRLTHGVRLDTATEGAQLRQGEKLAFRCPLRNHFLRGKAEVECLANGRWSDPFPTCGDPLGCARPPYVAGGDTKVTVDFQYRHNEKVEYICQNFYVMEGGPYKTCNNGEWTGEMRCIKPCTVDRKIMNAHNIAFRHVGDDKLYSRHDDVIGFMCISGTRQTGTVEMRQKCIDGQMTLPTCRQASWK